MTDTETLRKLTDDICDMAQGFISADDEIGFRLNVETLLAALTPSPEAQAEPVATVVRYTRGSYHRNYTLEWHKNVEAGAKLYAHPPAPQPDLAAQEQLKVTEAMIDAGLAHYYEGGCSGLDYRERREVVSDILCAALASVTAAQEGA